jgi:hypothetical protein
MILGSEPRPIRWSCEAGRERLAPIRDSVRQAEGQGHEAVRFTEEQIIILAFP